MCKNQHSDLQVSTDGFDAYYRLKRFCKRARKPHQFIKTSGITSFSKALERVV